jgi:nucleotide-binding universal stress UspA family protein
MRGPIAPILVAYTWSSGGRMALAWALREGGYRHQPVRVIHVVEHDSPTALNPTDARRRLASVMAQATNLGRVNVRTSADVLEGSLADRLIGVSSWADLLVFGHGAARRFDDPAWSQIWARVACPITIARGRMRVPDRRPVLVAVGERPRAFARTNDEAAHEADLRDVGLFALLSGSTDVSQPRMDHAQLVVADLPQEPRDNTLQWVVDHTPECPLLLVPSLETA